MKLVCICFLMTQHVRLSLLILSIFYCLFRQDVRALRGTFIFTLCFFFVSLFLLLVRCTHCLDRPYASPRAVVLSLVVSHAPFVFSFFSFTALALRPPGVRRHLHLQISLFFFGTQTVTLCFKSFPILSVFSSKRWVYCTQHDTFHLSSILKC